MKELGIAIIPLAAFWAAFNSIIKAAEFVNAIRDAVLSGTKDGAVLSRRAREAMLFDWQLAMTGIIASSSAFAFIMLWMGYYIFQSIDNHVGAVVGLTAIVPLFGTVLFILCGFSDRRAMRGELKDAYENS